MHVRSVTPLQSAPRIRTCPAPAGCPVSTTAPTHPTFVTRPQPARRASRLIATRARATNRAEKLWGETRPERWISCESVSTCPWKASSDGGAGEVAAAVCFEADPQPANSRPAENSRPADRIAIQLQRADPTDKASPTERSAARGRSDGPVFTMTPDDYSSFESGGGHRGSSSSPSCSPAA